MYSDALWNAFEIMEALNLRAVPSGFRAADISIDSRTIKPGEMYVAIRGDNLDGHDFVEDAFKKGACGVIVDRDWKGAFLPQHSYFVVDNTLDALQQLGAYARKRSAAKIVAVTGSVGKTTVKEWLNEVLSHFGITVASQKSFNNHWGVPLSLAKLRRDAQFGVFEIGMNHPGEIAPLSEMVQPHVACVTTVAEAHLGQMGSLQAIALEKSKIFSGLTEGGIAVIDADNPFSNFLKERAFECSASSVIGAGISDTADIKIIHYEINAKKQQAHIVAKIFDEDVAYTIPFVGEHHIRNSMIVLGICKALGLSVSRACTVLSKLKAIGGRGAIETLVLPSGTEITLIDDAYNANPSSMRAGLSVLKKVDPKGYGRRIAILGDMRELGDMSNEMHKNLHGSLEDAKADLLITVGDYIKKLYELMPSEKRIGHFNSYELAVAPMMETLQDGDVVFIKASNGVQLHKLVSYLRNISSSDNLKQVAVA